jgi:hypothetical protein
MRYIEDVQGADTPRTCCADYLIRFIISMILITMVIIVRAVKSSIIIFFYHHLSYIYSFSPFIFESIK